jgi:hypothetical protein
MARLFSLTKLLVLSPFRSQYQGSDSDVLIVVVRSSPLQSQAESSRESRGPSNTTKKSREVSGSSEKGGYSAGPVVVGTVMSNDEEASASWAACDLAKVLVDGRNSRTMPRVRLSEPFLTKNICTKLLPQEPLE